LQDSDGKDFTRGCGEPHSKLLVATFRDGFKEGLELLHEAGGQVAVLQEYPLSLIDAFFDRGTSTFALSLTERSYHKFLVHA